MRTALTAAVRPISLSASRREVRWNKLAPSRASRRLTALETVAFEVPRSAAARANEPISATLAKMAQASRSGKRGIGTFRNGVFRLFLFIRLRASRISHASINDDEDANMPKVLVLYYSSYG